MILVTVGTHNMGFDRLVRAMDELAAELDETVVIQYGSSRYIPEYAEHFQWCCSQEILDLTERARVVVCHAAAGAILAGLKANKPLVVIPRSAKFGEHVDDHQYQLSSAVSRSGRAVEVRDLSSIELKSAIAKAAMINTEENDSSRLVGALQDTLSRWSTLVPEPARSKR